MEGHIFMDIQTAQDETCGKKRKKTQSWLGKEAEIHQEEEEVLVNATKTQCMKF